MSGERRGVWQCGSPLQRIHFAFKGAGGVRSEDVAEKRLCECSVISWRWIQRIGKSLTSDSTHADPSTWKYIQSVVVSIVIVLIKTTRGSMHAPQSDSFGGPAVSKAVDPQLLSLACLSMDLRCGLQKLNRTSIPHPILVLPIDET